LDIKNREHFRSLDPEDFDRMNVGRKFWDASLDQIDDSHKYKEKIVSYIDNLGDKLCTGEGFLFWGERGTGKTATAVILAKAAVSYNHTFTRLINRAYMTTTTNAVDIMWGDSWDAKDDFIDLIQTADLFILDDLGMEKENSSVANAVENIIRMRLNSGKSLIVTTNLTNSRIDIRYGETFMRLLFDGECEPVEFAVDWRARNVKKFMKEGGNTND